MKQQKYLKIMEKWPGPAPLKKDEQGAQDRIYWGLKVFRLLHKKGSETPKKTNNNGTPKKTNNNGKPPPPPKKEVTK